jgi:DNA polymerase-3 subunit alpha
LKYKQFFVSGTFVAIRGKFEIPRNRKDPEFIISSIDLLYDLRDKKANQLNIRVSTKRLDQIFITDMNKLFLENQGKCAVKFVVFDPLDNIEIAMPSKSVKIDPNNEFIKTLRTFDIEFDLS